MLPKRRRTAIPLSQPFQEVSAANDTWCIDFKGWFRTRDGQRCDSLTLSDTDSRHLPACQIVPPTQAGVAPVVERIMREHGLPRAMRSDNGSPFASSSCSPQSEFSRNKTSCLWFAIGSRGNYALVGSRFPNWALRDTLVQDVEQLSAFFWSRPFRGVHIRRTAPPQPVPCPSHGTQGTA